MRDDFSALDLLSAGGFSWSPDGKQKKKKKKALFGLPKARRKGKAKRALTNLLPKLAAKVKPNQPSLQGWPVSISWPDRDEIH